jgi:opacity protein-like surface antigen
MLTRLVSAALSATLLTLPVHAQSSLGVTNATLALGLTDAQAEAGFVHGMINVAITDYHGLQANVDYDRTTTGDFGRIGAFQYMTPRGGQKYGLSLMIADMDDHSFTYGQIGVAGMFAIGDRLDLEVRAAIGMVAQTDLDWISLGAGLHWAMTPDLRVSAHYDIADFDERSFAARGQQLAVGIHYSPQGQPWGIFAEVGHDWLTGRNGGTGETTLRAGLTVSFGASNHGQPAFRVSDPMRQLLRRGLP